MKSFKIELCNVVLSREQLKNKFEAYNMKYDEYKKLCSDYVKDILGIADLLDPNDPYGIHEEMEDAFNEGKNFKFFIDEAFSEDISKDEYEMQLAAKAAEEEPN